MGKFASLGLNISSAERMPILHPGTLQPIVDEEGKESYLELLHQDSARGIEAQRRLTRKEFERQRRPMKQRIENAVDDDIEGAVDKITGLLTGWYLVGLDRRPIMDGDKPIPYTEQNAREFFSQAEMAWVRRQALAFVADAANFIKAPWTS